MNKTELISNNNLKSKQYSFTKTTQKESTFTNNNNLSMNLHKKSTKTLKLKSSALFAFQDDHIYNNICNEDSIIDDFHNHNWMNNSNLLSNTYNSEINFTIHKENHIGNDGNDENEESVCSISTEMQKNLDFLNEIYEDDLNKAKLSLDELLELDNGDHIQNDIDNLDENIDNIFNSHNLKNYRSYSNTKEFTFTTTQSFDFSMKAKTIQSSQQSQQSLNTFNKNYQQMNSQFYYPFNMKVLSNLKYGMNYSNIGKNRNVIGQNSFSIEGKYKQREYKDYKENVEYNDHKGIGDLYYLKDIKDNINNRSISQMYNKNLNSIMNYQSEEKYILDNIDTLLSDQNGCRILQKKLDEKTIDFISLFYEKIKFKLSFIINNQFGNYVMQKFIESCIFIDMTYLMSFIENIRGSLLSHSNDPYGSRVIQKLLDLINNSIFQCQINQVNQVNGRYSLKLKNESLLNKVVEILIDFAKNQMYSLINDSNGNHVYQKILVLSKKLNIPILSDELIKNIVELSKLKQGASVIQKAIEISPDSVKKSICLIIIKNIDKIINDEYGNFVVQLVLNMKNNEYTTKIFSFLIKNLFSLCYKKYASNVIDKCIVYDDCQGNKNRLLLIDHLINERIIPDIISDQYGNYIVQKALQVSDGIRFMNIIQIIKPCLKNMKNTSIGKKIYDSLIFNYGEYLCPQNQKNCSFEK